LSRGGPRIAKRKWTLARRNRFRQIDGRLYEGKLERRTIDDLTAHLGGEPTPAQQILIELSAKIVVTLDVMSVRMIESGGICESTANQYLAWVGHLRRNLETLGLRQPQAMPKRLADVIKLKGDAA
jgi:hypothetical protein